MVRPASIRKIRNHTITGVAIAEQMCFLRGMKTLLLLGLSLAIISCKSEPSDANNAREKEARISGEDHTALIREKLDAEQELALILADSDVDGEELEAAQKELTGAYVTLQSVQSDLPALRDLSEKITDHNSHLQRLRAGGNDSQIQLASAEIADLQQKLAALVKEQPEVREAQERVDRAHEKLAEARRGLARDLPEAKDLIDKIDALNRKLVEASR